MAVMTSTTQQSPILELSGDELRVAQIPADSRYRVGLARRVLVDAEAL